MKYPLFPVWFRALVLLAAFMTGIRAYGHPHDMPRVDVEIRMDESALVYKIMCPSFGIRPLKELQVDGDMPGLEAHRQDLQDFFAEKCPVMIDGIVVRPILTAMAFKAFPEAGPPPPADVLPSLADFDPPPPADSGFDNMALDFMDEPQWLDAYLTLSYRLNAKPKQVSMTWNLFAGDAVAESDMFLYSGETNVVEFYDNMGSMGLIGGPSLAGTPYEVVGILTAFGSKSFITFTPGEPEHVWHADQAGRPSRAMAVIPDAQPRRIKLPLLPLVAVGMLVLLLIAVRAADLPPRVAGLALCAFLLAGIAGQDVQTIRLAPFWQTGILTPEAPQALEIFEALHRNVYRAFDYETEDDIYDALDQSVASDLLYEIYNSIYQSLILRDQGGAVCKVEKVDILETEMLPPERDATGAGFRISCRWQVLGIVEHWGHAHRRLNEYDAVYALAPFEGRWKIHRVEMNAQKRIVGKKP